MKNKKDDYLTFNAGDAITIADLHALDDKRQCLRDYRLFSFRDISYGNSNAGLRPPPIVVLELTDLIVFLGYAAFNKGPLHADDFVGWSAHAIMISSGCYWMWMWHTTII